MSLSSADIYGVLRQFNPWWDRSPVPDLPAFRRLAFVELREWLVRPPAPRAVLLSGARQVGKTTLLLQVAQALIEEEGVHPNQILYATLDHPMLKLAGIERLLSVWGETRPRDRRSTDYLLLDEIQNVDGWATWLKHQVDFEKHRRIALTGSAMPLADDAPESGVGRWYTIKLPTLSFFEYLRIRGIHVEGLPAVASLATLFAWPEGDRLRVAEPARALTTHFHDYLLRGGFPQTALVENLSTAQRLLREDVVDRVLKRDMTALFGVRRVLEMEKTFLYLCLHDGGILNVEQLSKNLEVKKPTATRYLDLLEAAHLIYRLPPLGHGKEVLRARYKFYLADAAIAGSVLLKGSSLLEDGARLGMAVETAFFKHVFTRYYARDIRFFYWRDSLHREVDIVAEMEGEIIPFEVKYARSPVGSHDLKGLAQFCAARVIPRAYVITRDVTDFGPLPLPHSARAKAGGPLPTQVMKIPAPLACYWLSQSEHRHAG